MTREEKINIAELLKNCPTGMELDCPMYNNLYFDYIREHPIYPIICWTIDSKGNRHDVSFNWYGKSSSIDCAKCVIFPKGKTTWEGFQRPFMDGDIVATDTGNWIGITTGGKNNWFIPTYCVIKSNGNFEAYLDYKEKWHFDRFATEEEKAKLFDAIKENGYKWNPETKTLDKLIIKQKLKVGDWVGHHKYGKGDITQIFCIDDEIVYEIHFESLTTYCKANELCKYELLPTKFDITTLKTFDKVLVRHNKNNRWRGSFFSHIDDNLHYHCYKYVTIGGKSYPMCIPHEGNEHLCGTTDDCVEYYENWEE